MKKITKIVNNNKVSVLLSCSTIGWSSYVDSREIREELLYHPKLINILLNEDNNINGVYYDEKITEKNQKQIDKVMRGLKNKYSQYKELFENSIDLYNNYYFSVDYVDTDRPFVVFVVYDEECIQYLDELYTYIA